MVESPCTKDCCLNDEDVCVSCDRTKSEIIDWTNLTEQQKQKIIDRINNNE